LKTYHRAAIAVAFLCVALLSGCASVGTSVILLPQPDGRPSAVVMKTRGGERLLNQPFEHANALTDSTTAPTIGLENATRLRAAYPTLFDLIPPPAQRFELFFNAAQAVLTPASQQALVEALVAARARSGSDIVVTGHTDTVGAAKLNEALSLRRAVQVRHLFLLQGFPAERIEAVGRGMRELAISTPEGVDEPRNRRVTVDVR